MAKEIVLTQGKVAIVDDDTYEELNKHKWYTFRNGGNYYAARHSSKVAGERHIVFMHREVLGLKYGEKKIVDHIDHNGLDNRRSNLRIVSHSVNCRNHNGHSNNTSGHTGVCWHKKNNKWMAYIRVNKQITLGYFNDIADAIEARRLAEKKYWGEER